MANAPHCIDFERSHYHIHPLGSAILALLRNTIGGHDVTTNASTHRRYVVGRIVYRIYRPINLQFMGIILPHNYLHNHTHIADFIA